MMLNRTLAITTTTLALGVTMAAANPATATTTAPTPVSAQAPCGYYEDGPFAHWNNCSSAHVRIKADVIAWPDREYCVPSWTNLTLDSGAQRTRGARQIGTCTV